MAGNLVLPAIARRRVVNRYISTHPNARTDVASIAGQPASLSKEGHHLTCYLIAGQEVATRPYKLAADADLDQELAAIGCTRLTDAYRCMVDTKFIQDDETCGAEAKGLILVKDPSVGGWFSDDRMVTQQDFTPEEGDVFMLLLVQDTLSSLMLENVAFVVPVGDAKTTNKGSEFLVTDCFDVRYASIKSNLEVYRTMAFKGAN